MPDPHHDETATPALPDGGLSADLLASGLTEMALLDAIPFPLAILDEFGTIVAVNEAWSAYGRRNGRQNVDDGGRDYLAAIDESASETASEAATAIRELLAGDRDGFDLEYPCHAPDEQRWSVLRAGTVDLAGERYVAVAHVDVTDRVVRERELELTETLLETQRSMALLVGGDGEILLANARFAEVTGVPTGSVVGRRYDDLPPAIVDNVDSFEQVAGLLSQVLAGGLQVASTEVTYERADGETITASIRMAPSQIDADATGAILTAVDVTDRERREEALRLYERAVESSSELLAAVDEDGAFLFANAAYREAFGLTEPVEGSSLDDVVSPGEAERVAGNVERALAGESVAFEDRREMADGTVHPFEVRYRPLRDRSGEIMGVVGALRDVSRRSERERQLQVMDRVLRHNLHNDMNVVTGYAEMIADRDDGDLAEYAETIRRTGEALLETVDKQRVVIDLLTESHSITRVSVDETVADLLAAMRERYPEATFEVDVEADSEAHALSHLSLALEELLENAITHGDDVPRVSVSVSNGPDVVEVVIGDGGPGIPEPEWRVLTGDRDIDPLYHGSGMGLWMVNWIVTRSGGSLEFVAEGGPGSTVRVELPAAPDQSVFE